MLSACFPMISVFTMAFWPEQLLVLVTGKTSSSVVCICWSFSSLCDLWNSGVLRTDVTSDTAGLFCHSCRLGYGDKVGRLLGKVVCGRVPRAGGILFCSDWHDLHPSSLKEDSILFFRDPPASTSPLLKLKTCTNTL